MNTLKVKKLYSYIVIIKKKPKFSYALHVFSVIFVHVYLTSVCVVFAPMTSQQDGLLCTFQAESGTAF